MAKRIYCVTTSHAKPITRLVRADSAAQAFRHVAGEIITAELASQDDLIDATKAGIVVETAAATDDPKPAAVASTDALQGPPPGAPMQQPITELPAHLDRRQKAAVG